MEEIDVRTTEKSEKTKKKKEEIDPPDFCTQAPSAEHARAGDANEPCDDGRGGNVKSG